MTTAAAEVTSPGTPQGQNRTPAPKTSSKAPDPKEELKKRMAEAVKNNQAAADETEGDDDAPEPETVTEYPEGDPDQGAIDPENPDRPIAHRDRRAYLVQQAERNQAANDQLNAMQVAQNKRLRATVAELQNPDYMRETSMQTAITALKAHDPEEVEKRRDAAEKLRKERADKEKKNGK